MRIIALFLILNAYLHAFASESEVMQSIPLPEILGEGGGCLECVYLTTGPFHFVEKLEPPLDGEVGYFHKVYFLRSEAYYSILIEKILKDDSKRPRVHKEEVLFFSNLDIRKIVPGSVTMMSFLEWRSVDSFVIELDGRLFEVGIEGSSLVFNSIDQ